MPIPVRFSYYSYSFVLGAIQRYADYFDPRSKMASCYQNIRLVEAYLIKLGMNNPGKYVGSSLYDYITQYKTLTVNNFIYYPIIEQEGELLRNILMLSNNITNSCYYGFKLEID
jgi:hypothetical protein